MGKAFIDGISWPGVLFYNDCINIISILINYGMRTVGAATINNNILHIAVMFFLAENTEYRFLKKQSTVEIWGDYAEPHSSLINNFLLKSVITIGIIKKNDR